MSTESDREQELIEKAVAARISVPAQTAAQKRVAKINQRFFAKTDFFYLPDIPEFKTLDLHAFSDEKNLVAFNVNQIQDKDIMNINRHEIFHLCEKYDAYRAAKAILKKEIHRIYVQRFMQHWKNCNEETIWDEITVEGLNGNFFDKTASYAKEVQKLGRICLRERAKEWRESGQSL